MCRRSIFLLVGVLAVIATDRVRAAVPPLTETQIARLDLAKDDHDHHEDAFVALLSHVRDWIMPLEGVVGLIDPDPGILLEDPPAWRGQLCRLRGAVQQQTVLSEPHDDVMEWFIRDPAGRPFAIYLPVEDATGHRVGDSVEIFARFYKRLAATSRDGEDRRYAGFVGALPMALAPTTGMTGTNHWILIIPVAIMLIVFTALLLYARRQRRRSTPIVNRTGEPVQADLSLPADPADALAVLRDRAGSSERTPDPDGS